MKPETFTRVAKLSDLNGAGPFALSANGADIVLLKAGGSWRAFDGRCPHQGALLGEGELDGGALVCRNHRWRFSVDSGHREGGPECLASCPVAEREGSVFVDISGLNRSAVSNPTARSLDDLPGPKGLPLVGNMHQLDATKVHLIFEDWAARYGSIYHFRMGSTRVVVTMDPAMIEEALRARPEVLRRDAKMDVILSEIGIRGVFNAEGEAWRPQRKLSVAALAQRNLRQLYPSIRTVAERMKSRWEKSAASGDILDVVAELKRFTVDVTMLIAFGYDANTVEQADHLIQQELEVVFPAISRRIFAIFPSWRYVQLPSDRRLTRALAKVREWLDGLLTDARARLKAEPERAQKPSNFIEAMLTSLDENGKSFTDDVIMSNLITMLLAGEDTTAFTLAWTVHQLCDSPRWEAELRSEADAVIGLANVAVDLDTANKLAVASAVANETMRLRPVAPFLGFLANVDMALGDVLCSEGNGRRCSPAPTGSRSNKLR